MPRWRNAAAGAGGGGDAIRPAGAAMPSVRVRCARRCRTTGRGRARRHGASTAASGAVPRAARCRCRRRVRSGSCRSLSCVFSQPRAQQAARAVQLCLGAADGHVEFGCDFLVRPAFDVVQHQHRACARRQGRDGTIEVQRQCRAMAGGIGMGEAVEAARRRCRSPAGCGANAVPSARCWPPAGTTRSRTRFRNGRRTKPARRGRRRPGSGRRRAGPGRRPGARSRRTPVPGGAGRALRTRPCRRRPRRARGHGRFPRPVRRRWRASGRS